MWLCNSSVGRKVVMSITGLALVLFLTFHMAMNLVAVISGDAYNWICEMLGANWYALVATVALAGLVVLHFVYAIWLTLQNRRARGSERYAVTAKPKMVEWSSQNMFVLGLIVVLGLGLHLFNFWYKMQFVEILEMMGVHDLVATGGIAPTDGAAFIAYTFSQPVYVILYLIWLAALWFHLTHGFWSSLQTLGWSNKTWINRWRITSDIYSTIIVAGFALVVVVFFVKSLCGAC
ncbi:succinate dehydrogenase/fumarate reductase cytochrome b subunit [Bacteroides sp. 51]|uniref:succinate dehydrogenase/fumarate reductase cytochrome b subunit n=1 Tax=Bacteroides sp. 51 TaxID=2302938 RepID=UPI0013D6AF3B|nr:succinate dehydrogenase/fumarate reductase cytochrome b subunit [Bacteroides sp. 51]NDV80609.1 succinate dehydrogenase/fumarate reductase cytochrome b subunit [Bacteroides sp. 51]